MSSAYEDLEKTKSMPTKEEMQQLTGTVKVLLRKQRELKQLEKQEKDLKQEIRTLEMETIPDIMESAGMRKFETEDGDTVSVKDIVQATIPKKTQEEALQWLEEHDAGDLIKADLIAHYNRDEVDQARSLFTRLRDEEGIDVDIVQRVHPQTLSAWIREQMKETGELPPEEYFSIFTGRKAVVK